MIPYDAIMVPLSATLGLSLVVERILEFAKNITEPFLNNQKSTKLPELAHVDRLIDDLEKTCENEQFSQDVERTAESQSAARQQIKAELDREPDPAKRKQLTAKLTELEKNGEWNEQFSNATVLIEPATDPDKGKSMKIFILQMLGFALGILLAHYSGIQLFKSFINALDGTIKIAPWLDYLLTGMLVGGGSGPMHILIRLITQRKVLARGIPAPAQIVTESPAARNMSTPALITPPSNRVESEWINLAYNGGVDCEKLEWVHQRGKNPDCIVYHHTAMNSKSSFKDVVRVIKNTCGPNETQWLTGYNCVVLEDGSIHPFCRWDRYGNHAVGYNRRSLGLAFNGNFETDPRVPYSNSDGKFGRTRPSEAQLRAGAQVVVLWTFIYPINVDFEKTIIPHNKISSKACPGSRFPYDEFKKWIEYYRNHWGNSDEIQQRIAAFRLKPYLYIKNEEL